MTEANELISAQRLPSRDFAHTWTEEDQFDWDLWRYHDAHHEPTRYAVCVICCTEMESYRTQVIAENAAVYNYAKELDQEIARQRAADKEV